jgi:hypothetical protein
LEDLAISELAAKCSEETTRFFKQRSHNPAFCYELFRRALEQREERAWELIYAQYQKLVEAWVYRHSFFSQAEETVAHFVNLAFERLWSAISEANFKRFPDLPSILRYLQMCIHSALADHMRVRQLIQLRETSGLDLPIELSENPGFEELLISRDLGNEIWQCVENCLKSDAEKLVAYGSFLLDLKPRQIASRYEGIFADVDDVYRVKQNVFDRLRRNRELQELAGLNA